MSEKKSLKDFTYVTLGGTIPAGLQAGFYIIFATILEPEIYGKMAYFIALAGTFSVIGRFGFPHSIVVFQAKGNLNASNQAKILALITISAASIILIYLNVYAALLCFGLSLYSLNQSNFLGSKKYKEFFQIGLLKGILIISLPILLYFVWEIPGILIGIAISNFIPSTNFLKKLNRQVQSFDFIKKKFKILSQNFFVDSSISLTRWVDKLLIVPFFGFTFVGIYHFNLQILFALVLIPTSLHSYLLAEESHGRTQKKVILIATIGSIFLVILTIFLGPYVISSLFPKYSEGIESLQILIISLVPLTITAMLTAQLQAKYSTKVGFPSLARLGSLLVLLFVLGQWFGLIGFALAVLFSTIIELILLFIVYLDSKSKTLDHEA